MSFNNDVPQAQWILLNNPRDEVERFIQQYSLNMRANFFYYKCLGAFKFFFDAETILFQFFSRIEIKSHFPLKFHCFIWFKQLKFNLSVTPNLIPSFFSSKLNLLLSRLSLPSTEREATIMNFSAPYRNQLARGGHVILDQSSVAVKLKTNDFAQSSPE